MFKPESETFFTYVFVFAVPEEQKLTDEVIQTEMLAYYRGLAHSLMKKRGKPVDTEKFSFEMKKAKEVKNSPVGTKNKEVTQHTGTLDWVEPFATAKPQTLHFELQSWHDPKTKKNYLFVCTAPVAIKDDDARWKELRPIRRTFAVKTAKQGE